MVKRPARSRDILLITLGFPPARGGIQSCLYERCRIASDRFVVLAPDCPGTREFDEAQPFPIYRWPPALGNVPGLRRVCQLLFPLILGWTLCRRYPICQIECGQALPFGVVARLLQATNRFPYRIWTFGDDIIKPAGWPLIRWLLVRILRRAETIIAISQFTRRHLQTLGLSDERIRVIHPPIDLQQFHPRKRPTPEMEYEIDAPMLLTTARLEERKGIHVVLQMLPALLEQFPNLIYVVAGQGPAESSLRASADRLGVSDCVRFVGDVCEEDLATQYLACNIFVMLPTPNEEKGEVEGFGMVYLEAAASGRPAVAWRTGGVEEAVIHERTGLLVQKDDIEAARQAILALLANPERLRTIGQEARIWAEQTVNHSVSELSRLDDVDGPPL